MLANTTTLWQTDNVLVRRLIWFALGILAITVFAGRAYDGYWHATRPFDDFFSPPHIFVYVLSVVNITLVALLGLTPHVPRGAVGMTLAGLGVVALGGLVLDNLWHTNFGLNETLWSAPHALLQWGWLLAALGLVSTLVNLHPTRSFSYLEAVSLALVIIAFSLDPVLGPFHRNNTPEFIRAFMQLPAFIIQPTARLPHQLYLDWNLTRASPLAAPLSALWVGAVIAFIHRLDRRLATLWLATGLWTGWMIWLDYTAARQLDQIAPLSHQPANWLPAPLFPSALVFVSALILGLSERMAYVLAAVIHAIIYLLVWQPSFIFLVLVLPATMFGALIGARLHTKLQSPTGKRGVAQVLAPGLLAPIILGVIDLAIRSRYL